jgi:gamma-glutamylcyclotransferase
MTDTILYFAYGSNMMIKRLKGRAPSAISQQTGFVQRHRLTFDKVSRDGSGKCDLEPTGIDSDRVYGVLFRIEASEEINLDEAEGLGKGYQKAEIMVTTSNGEMTALAYIATKKDPARLPYHWYKALVIAGAVEHNLPASYVEWLRAVPSQPDPKLDRVRKNEALLLESS